LSFTKALDLSFDGASIFGGDRSKRYALVVENGLVKEAHVEPDNTGLNGTFHRPYETHQFCIKLLIENSLRG